MSAAPDPVIAWLLEGDPAIRWQVFRDLLERARPAVAREQGRIAREGWGARLLDLQESAGGWAGLYNPKWTSTTYTLLLLCACGLPERSSAARAGARLLLDAGLATDSGINFWPGKHANSETCITGMVLTIASRFAADDPRLEKLVEYLLSEQMPDGGWNCRRRRGAVHSSLHTTILALEGLLAYESGSRRRHAAQTAAARERAHEFLFVHRMFRSHRTGSIIDARMTRFSFPPQWHYDVLRGLDYLRAANAPKDQRLTGAIELLKARSKEGRWLLQVLHRGQYHFPLEKVGQPSRWNTLRALRVLRWWESQGDSPQKRQPKR